MSIELEKAARAAAQRKLNAGLEPRDPVAGGMQFQERQTAPKWLVIVLILAALLTGGLTLSYLYTIPPSHLLIIGFGLFCLFSWGIRKNRRGN